MNPLASHWLRVAVALFLASPLIALLVALTTGVDFVVAIIITLYMWAGVSVILALIAAVGLAVHLVGRGFRALRR